MKRVYLDYAASTPVDTRVMAAMEPYFSASFGNPGSLHSFGQDAMAAVDRSRETIAAAIGAPPAGGFREVIFTSSATEANNLALRGALKAFSFELLACSRPSGLFVALARPKRSGGGKRLLKANSYKLKPKIIVSAIEHESVLATARDLERSGEAEVAVVPVDKRGIVDIKKLARALDERTILVSVMYANNEIGTIQPIFEIGKVVADFRKNLEMRNERTGNTKSSSLISYISYPLFHTDAVQALQFLPCNVNELGVDLMTLSAHKIYGPKGVGALYVRGGRWQVAGGSHRQLRRELSPLTSHLSPFVTGGGQEFGMRSGTENVPAIVGFAEAVMLAGKYRQKESERLRALVRYAFTGIRKIVPHAAVNGVHIQDKSGRLPSMLNMYIPKVLAEELLTRLDIAGIAASSGSACSSRSFEESSVIRALGHSTARAKRSIRVSLGRGTRKEDIDALLKILGKSLRK
jgi:cysteine desulfurase